MKQHKETPRPTRERASGAVMNAFAVLESFDREHPAQTLSGISRRLGIPKASAFRNLAALEVLGYVTRDPDNGQYSLGPSILELSKRFLEQNSLVAVARPVLNEISAQTGETAHLGVLVGTMVVYIEISESARRVRALVNPGDRLEAHAVASGKAILAYSSAETVGAVAAGGLKAFTGRTLRTKEELYKQLAATRARGYATMSGEWMDDVSAVSAPVFGHSREVVAAVGIAAPRSRVGPEKLAELGPTIRSFADKISSGLGGRDPTVS